ncbi:small GTP-binding protein [Ferroglobus placidus DSM 10642]|uniref:Small GTP-binding protein n=1 Tax=Ferroglobus placidus (strain DSM 10642 / AEDII12DO) TaxID=589924 RepID=D3S205_FERPA|nr:GTPase [Ferroglobus placidus]ADC64462.1 small GTP-binding protein [Ferroglobus placidus DSM 10642]
MSFSAKELPTVLTAQEIIDKAYRRASRVGGRTSKERALNKLATISNVLRDYFKKVVEAHPSYDNLPPFYREMIDIIVGVRRIKKSLAAIAWADRMTQKVISKGVAQIKGGKDPRIVLKEVYGRVASIIEQIDDELKFLNEAREKLKEIPTLSEDFTVVLAGYPNVGKSSIIAEISSVKPEVASYPFTTKKISVGFVEDKDVRIQVIDTPGILDRPISRRNEIEKRAIVALKHLADLIVFVIDPTETCGYSLENQLNLLREVKETFKKPLIEIYSKSDLHDFKDRMRVSVVTKEGIAELLNLIKEEARKSKSRG